MDQYGQNGQFAGQQQQQAIDPNLGGGLEPVMFLHGQAEADFNWAPVGRYPLRIHEATATRSKSENASSMLKLKLVIEGSQGGLLDGISVFDNAITEKGKPGAGFGVKKLRGLGVNVDSEVPIPLSQIAQSLIGKVVFADLDIEPSLGKDPTTGEYNVAMTTIRDGKQVQVMKNKIVAYYVHAVQPTQQLAQAPIAQAPQQFNPPFTQQMPQQSVQAPQFQQLPPQQMQGQQLAPQFTQQMPQQQIAPQQFPPQGGAPAPWATAPTGKGKKS